MRKYVIVLMFLGGCMALESCKEIASEPPRSDGDGLSKRFIMPKPKPITAEQKAFVAAAKAEYEQAITKSSN